MRLYTFVGNSKAANDSAGGDNLRHYWQKYIYQGVIMSNKIIVTKTSTMVDVFYVPDTPENRQAVERGEYDKVIYDHDGYYQYLVDSYGEEEKITHRLPD